MSVLDLIDPSLLRIEVWPIEGLDQRGGQHTGHGHSGVRVTHLPSGTTAFSRLGRSQHANRAIALDMILSAITHPQHR